jgi:KUP system potassium uptake protein
MRQIAHRPQVLAALSPLEGWHFFRREGWRGFRVLGSVVLAITGGEALYADLGHFGRRAIRLSWFALAMPALVLDYLGQGALLLEHPGAVARPFFAMASGRVETGALVALATVATVIASQALISGAFSLTHQAVALGFFPTVTIRHTSGEAEGQIYIPEMNWILAAGCLALVLAFRESNRLAAAYGVAVTGTMGITSLIFFEVTRTTWKWPLPRSLGLLLLFLSFDLPFFGASLAKFASGGFVPVAIGAIFFAVMITWKRGWELYRRRMARALPDLASFVASGPWKNVARVPGTGVFVRGELPGVPAVLSCLVTQVRAVPRSVVLFGIRTIRAPQAGPDAVQLEIVDGGIYALTLSSGFMQRPNVPAALAAAITRFHLPIELPEVTYYLERHTFVGSSAGQMGRWSERLFAFLTRNASPVTDRLGIPWQRVVEIGTEIDL